MTSAANVSTSYKFTAIVILHLSERCIMEFNWQSDIEFLRGLLDSDFRQEVLDSEVGCGQYTFVADTMEAEWHSLEKSNLNRYFESLEMIPYLPRQLTFWKQENGK